MISFRTPHITSAFSLVEPDVQFSRIRLSCELSSQAFAGASMAYSFKGISNPLPAHGGKR
jgi:hypothetical protein